MYEELVKMKGNKSFSELLRELIKKKKKGNLDALIRLARAMNPDRLEKISKEIEEAFEKWRESLTKV